MSTGFPPSSPYYRPYPGTPYARYPAWGNNRYTNLPYAGTQYPAHRLSRLKQQMSGRVINTSREPVTLSQLAGKHDGDPVTAHAFVNPHYTGVATVDGAVQRAGSVMGYVPQAIGNFVSIPIKGAVVGGGGALALTSAGLLIGKLLGKFKGLGGWWLGIPVLAGFGGACAGGIAGFFKAGFDTLRDLKDIVFGNR
jgi:hypothetical protein